MSLASAKGEGGRGKGASHWPKQVEGKAKMAAVDTGIGNEADGGANQSGRHERAVVALQLLLFHNYYYHSFFFVL